ncbi:TetR family transcriptional regulator [Streptomyces brasiliensis]|uniref:TetR family transcriptional regulator n=2 Tax=Streptomyces brasiliensis TaxID=1954 RepID=A0A917LA89_9ACTN|nr:TetR family transcriptional regulator [Streptomyces brasiliensis]
MSADDRRTAVVGAAIIEFASRGYVGTSTQDIARRAGVSQPYLFRLFPGKRALFLAAATRCVAEIAHTLVAAAEGLEGEQARRAMAIAYTRVILSEPQRLLMQMQVYAAVAGAEAAGDHEFGETVRAQWQQLWQEVRLALGTGAGDTAWFMSRGILVNVLLALGFPPGHRVWAGLDPSIGAAATHRPRHD